MAMKSSLVSVIRRWRRNLLTVLAMAIGSAAVVAMLGISQTTAQRITERITAYDATTVSLSLPSDVWETEESSLVDAAHQIPGILAFGTLVLPDAGTPNAHIESPLTGRSALVGIAIATGDGLKARTASTVSGALPSGFLSTKDPYSVVLGRALAGELSVNTDSGSNRVTIDGRSATVVGIVSDGPGFSVLNTTLVLSPQSAAAMGVTHDVPRSVAVLTDPGSAASIGAQLPIALYPQDPSAVSSSIPPSPDTLRDQLVGDTRSLVLLVTAVMVGATSFSIITTMQISVWERRREIGLARAMGQSRWRVAGTMMAESITLGAVGSAMGWAFGILIVSVVTAINQWTMTLPYEVLAIPVIGVAVGALGGLLPAANAAKIDPAELLRS